MKPHSLPVRRKPAPKGIFKRLSAVTNQRKQRVAAAAAMEDDDSSSKISRALTIIFLIHIVAIGLIFVHQKFLDGKTLGAPAETAKTKVAVPERQQVALPKLSVGEEPYIVSQGDNYARIADKLGVDEGDLRLANEHAEIKSGIILKVPPKRIVAQEPAEIVSIRRQQAAEPDRGLVENIDIADAPRAKLVRPASGAAATPSASSGKTYVVKSGDSIWRIANKFGVDQDTLMKTNGISDPRKMKIGMNLVIP